MLDRHAAVLIAVYQNSIILTKRARTLRTFAGHICLPGGMYEVEDDDLTTTAIREFHEEVNFVGTVDPLFCLVPEFSPTAIHNIHPIVAKLNGQINNFNQDEVEKLFLLKLSDLSDNLFMINKELPHIIHNWCFNYADEYIWGVTASILKKLCLYKDELINDNK